LPVKRKGTLDRVLFFFMGLVGSADYIFSELYNIYPVVKISMEKLERVIN